MKSDKNAGQKSSKPKATSRGGKGNPPETAGAEKPKKKLSEVPAILLEGDSTPTPQPQPGGPGSRYALAPEPVAPHLPATEAELPESYGTGQLFLSARDPHWVFAAWDLPTQKQREFNAKSRDGHLVLRVYANDESTVVIPDVHIHPESRTWFIYVPRPETRYRAELGYFDVKLGWQQISKSRSTFTPPDAPSEEFAAEFATIPSKITFQELVASVQEFISENQPLVEAILIASQHENGMSTPAQVTAAEPWSKEQINEITELLSIDTERRLWMGSVEITALIRRHLQEENASIAAAKLAQAESPELGALSSISLASSPTGVHFADQRKFWFNINAELVIYGATEPGANVEVAGRTIKLRPDGTFSFRFALPDGRYDLPVVATAPDFLEWKKASLHFSRATEYTGKVEAHPQDPALRSPSVENLS